MPSLLRRLFGQSQPSAPTGTTTSRPQPARLHSAARNPSLLGGHETLEVVGESFYQDALWVIVGRTVEPVREPVTAILEPEPTNPYDANAIQVIIDRHPVGHLSREDARHYLPGLIKQIATCNTGCIGLTGVIAGGGPRGGRIGYLGVFLNHDPHDFDTGSHHETMLGHIRTGYSYARATDLQDDSYDLSWSNTLSRDPWTSATQLHALLKDEHDSIDRHFMLAELSKRLYKCRDTNPSALTAFDEACHQHDQELATLRPALVEKFGTVPVIEMYHQAVIRHKKNKDWQLMHWWAERGITIYGADSPHIEDVLDLQKRAAYAAAELDGTT